MTALLVLLAVPALAAAINLHVWRVGRRFVRSVDSVPHAPIVLVLGARVWPGGVPTHALEDRLITAQALLDGGRATTLLLSGDNRPGHGEVDAMEAFLVERGVPRACLLRDEAAATTHASLVRARGLFGARELTIVTQAFHLPRALYSARRLGLIAHGVEADRRPYASMARNHTREAGARLKAFVRRH